MRCHEHRAIGKLAQTTDHPLLASGIERGRGLVEQQHGRAAVYSSGNGEPLPLPFRKSGAALSQTSIEPAGQAANELVGAGRIQGVPNARVIGSAIPVGKRNHLARRAESRQLPCGTYANNPGRTEDAEIRRPSARTYALPSSG